MGINVTVSQTQQYTSNVQMLLQQKQSRLRKAVTEDTYVGRNGQVVQQVGAVTAKKKTTRNSDTPLIDTPHGSRFVNPVDYEYADLIDKQDRVRTIAELSNPYARAGAMAMKRAMDDEIIQAFFGTAKTGNDGTGSEAFDTSNFQIAAGSAGMTIAKLRQAKRILLEQENDWDEDDFYIALSARQFDDLLATTEISSRDYNTVAALKDGTIDYYMGFNFIHSERLQKTGNNRRVPVWAKSGMHLGVWDDMETDISQRKDKSNAWQVYVCATFGGTRLENGKVIEVLCDES